MVNRHWGGIGSVRDCVHYPMQGKRLTREKNPPVSGFYGKPNRSPGGISVESNPPGIALEMLSRSDFPSQPTFACAVNDKCLLHQFNGKPLWLIGSHADNKKATLHRPRSNSPHDGRARLRRVANWESWILHRVRSRRALLRWWNLPQSRGLSSHWHDSQSGLSMLHALPSGSSMSSSAGMAGNGAGCEFFR